MCTGIFLFRPRPILALYFDYNRTFRLTLENDSAFCMRIRYGNYYGLPLGVNKDRCSANIQLAPFLGNRLYDSNLSKEIQLHQIIHRILLESQDIRSLPSFLKDHNLVYTTEDVGAHCLCADRNGNICIIDPGTGCLTNDAFEDDFAVLTNFTLANHLPLTSNTKHIPCRRYKTAYAMLLKNHSGTEQLMTVLEAVKQSTGNLPTIFSMVAELDTGEIHFTLDGDFSKCFHFSFSDNSLYAGTGHNHPHCILLDSDGISAAELRNWE